MKLVSARELLLDALRDFRRTWPQLTLADLMARVLAATLLAPLVGLLLRLFLATTPDGVVTDASIVGFLLHPAGFLALIIVVSVSLAIVFVEAGQVMVIGVGAWDDRDVSWLEALRYALGRGPALLRFAGLAAMRLLWVALPFLAALGALYGLLLRTYDINYYLTEKPPVFLAAIATAGLLLAILAVMITLRIADWLLALPLILFDAMTGREALNASVKAIAPHRWRLAWWLVAWIIGVSLLFAAVTLLVSLLANGLISLVGSRASWLLISLIAALGLGGLANLAVSVFTTALFPLVVARLHKALGGGGALPAKMAAAGSLGARPVVRFVASPSSWPAPG